MALSKKNETALRRCRSLIAGAKQWRQQEGYDDLWRRLNDLYRGRHFPEPLNTEDRIVVNIAFSTINIIAPSVAVNHPKITVSARLPEHEDRSLIVESVINYWWRTYDIKPEFRSVVKDYLIYGFGWMKTGYRYVEEEVERKPEEVQAELAELTAEVDAFAAEDPDLGAELPTDEEIEANIVSTEMRVVDDRPFAERVSPHDIYVDPEATSPRDMRWIAQRVIKDLEDVRQDKRYKRSARRAVKADALVKESMRDPQSKPEDTWNARVTVWEFYDVKAGTMCVFTEHGDDFLVEPMDQPYAFGHPFRMLANFEVPEFFYPIGELEAIEDLQQELNKTRSQMMNDRRRYARKYLVDARAFDSKGLAAIRSTRDGEIAIVNEGVPLNEAMIAAPQTPLDPSIYQQSNVIEADINTITGVSEYMRGGGEQAIRRTATEASIIQDAANARAADKLTQIEDFISQVARHLVMLSQQYMSEAQVVRVVGQNNAPLWFEFDPTMIQGEYDFEVEGGSTQPKNEYLRRQEAIEMMQALGPLAVPGGPINIEELLRHVLQNGFGIKDPSKFIMSTQPLIDPMTGQPLGAPPGTEATGVIPTEPPPAETDEPGGPDTLAQLQGQVGLNLQNSGG